MKKPLKSLLIILTLGIHTTLFFLRIVNPFEWEITDKPLIESSGERIEKKEVDSNSIEQSSNEGRGMAEGTQVSLGYLPPSKKSSEISKTAKVEFDTFNAALLLSACFHVSMILLLSRCKFQQVAVFNSEKRPAPLHE